MAEPTVTPTSNPVPSKSGVDLIYNAETLDIIVNSQADSSATDRFGNEVDTIKGYQDKFKLSLLNTGLFPASGSFNAGGSITERNQFLQLVTTVGDDIAGGYTWGGTLPKTVTAGSTPSSTGGLAPNAWVYRGDATLSNIVMVREVNSAEEEAEAFASGALAVIRMDLIAPRSSLFMDFKAPFAFLDKSEFFHEMTAYGAVIDTTPENQSPMGIGVGDFTAGFLTTSDHPSLRLTGGWGMECYFKLSGLSSNQFILSKGFNEVLNTGWYFGLLWNGSIFNIAFAGKDNDTMVFQAYAFSGDVDNYHHISLNSDGVTISLYVDGVIINQYAQTEISNNNSSLWVGGWNFDPDVRSGYIAQLILSNDGPLRTGPFTPPII